jgi:putative DNA methylase
MSEYKIKSPRKLIEVALPLDSINTACGREKSIRHGHPCTLHLWWARRPLASCRAVIFAQLVNDPGYQQGGGFKYGINKKEAAIERKRLFKIIEELVFWENTTNYEVLEKARNEIRRSWKEICDLNSDHPDSAELFNPNVMPALHDAFAGGGAIPLEAQRLGLHAYASDLNPVAVIINKAMIEIPSKFNGMGPISNLVKTKEQKKTIKQPRLDQTEFYNSSFTRNESEWKGLKGLAEDVNYYGEWIRNEAEKRIGKLYPNIIVTNEMAFDRDDLKQYLNKEVKVISWIWARTVKSPNPAFSHIDVPLATSFVLCQKEGNEVYIEPCITNSKYSFKIKKGKPTPEAKKGTKSNGSGSTFFCLISQTPMEFSYLRNEAKLGRMGQKLMAVIAEGKNGRIYLPPSDDMEKLALDAVPEWIPETSLPDKALGFRVQEYGMLKWSNLFTSRQLVALTTFSELVNEARLKILDDVNSISHLSKEIDHSDVRTLNDGGLGPNAYADAVSVYLAFAIGKLADYNSSLCSWGSDRQTIRNTFGRQAIPMVWDFAEANPLGDSTGSYSSAISQGVRVIRDGLSLNLPGYAYQADAQTQTISNNKIISIDPPYYDNIGYADLSDFFYVWMRKCLRYVYPNLLATISVPKAQELVATPFRHGSKANAELFFLNGMTQAIGSLAKQSHQAYPITIYYAFKQSDTKGSDGTSSTGWETFLEAVNRAGLQLTGTWPMRTELSNRMVSSGTNALASSIVLVCRKRAATASSISRREFIRELNIVLPEALDEMTKGSGDERSPVAPVDLSQAIIGPGIAVYSKYKSVLEADGSPMSMRTALQLINRFLAEDDFDSNTQFCLSWFEQNGWDQSDFGTADILARGKGTSVDGIKEANLIQSGSGKVRLVKWQEYPNQLNLSRDIQIPIWQALHQLIKILKQDGETASGILLAKLGDKAEAVRQLAYRLYTLCERLGQTDDARSYNELITSWTGLETAASEVQIKAQDQQLLGFEN